MTDKDDMQGLPDKDQLDREGPADDIPASAENPNVAHVQYLDEPPVKRGPGRSRGLGNVPGSGKRLIVPRAGLERLLTGA
jgi:hypothetical protein